MIIFVRMDRRNYDPTPANRIPGANYESQLTFLRLLSSRATQNVTFWCQNMVAVNSIADDSTERALKLMGFGGEVITRYRTIRDECAVRNFRYSYGFGNLVSYRRLMYTVAIPEWRRGGGGMIFVFWFRGDYGWRQFFLPNAPPVQRYHPFSSWGRHVRSLCAAVELSPPMSMPSYSFFAQDNINVLDQILGGCHHNRSSLFLNHTRTNLAGWSKSRLMSNEACHLLFHSNRPTPAASHREVTRSDAYAVVITCYHPTTMHDSMLV